MSLSQDILPVIAPAQGLPGPPQGDWTYADYTLLPDDGNRYEVIQGVIYMAPSPSIDHQEADANFVYYLHLHVKQAGLGRVFPAPIDVELASNDTVQPDVVVVLKNNYNRIEQGKIVGAPDLVIEIASPSTAGYDRREKQDAYARAGVLEYWLADPIVHHVEVLLLEQNRYRSLGVFRGQALLPSSIIPGLPVRVEQFFE